MHTPSLIRLLATGLMAASAVAGFHGPAASSLAVRYAGALVVAGVAILPSAVTAAPTGEDGPVEAREAKKKKKGGKKKKKTKARGLVSAPTEIEERHAAITEDHQRDARDPEAKKKKKGGKKKKTKARGLVSEPAEMDERDVDELEARDPEAKKKKKKGGKKKKTKARSLVASEPAGMEERDLDGLDARDPEAKKEEEEEGRQEEEDQGPRPRQRAYRGRGARLRPLR